MSEPKQERAKPVVLTDGESGKTYTLEFSRETVAAAERMGLDIVHIDSSPESSIPVLFYAAFQRNHRGISRAETDRILYDELGGLTSEELGRLIELYTQAVNALRLTGGERKNARMKLTLS